MENKISGYILTHNSESTIIKAIKSIMWVDQIVIYDDLSEDGTIKLIDNFRRKNNLNLIIRSGRFDGHFGDRRNRVISEFCDNEWFLGLDSDEYLEEGAEEEIRTLINSRTCDAVKIPRMNYLDGEITDVYPDYQFRIARSFCRYIYSVHEELTGYRKALSIKSHIMHYKTTEKQNEQNKMYADYDKYNPYIIARLKRDLRYSYEAY